MLLPDYYKVLLEIEVGRRFWQSNPSAENADAYYVRVVKPLRRLQRRGVVEKLQEITATDDKTPVAVEIMGQITKAMKADSDIMLPVKYWEIVADKLSALAGQGGYCSAVTQKRS